MPARTAQRTRDVRKTGTIGSARKEAVAARRPPRTGAKVARGINADKRPRLLNPRVHPKKDPPARSGRAAKAGQVTVRSPYAPGYSANLDAAKYTAMRDVLLQVIPNKQPGITQGEMFEAVRETAPRSVFPGATDRWWAKSVQLDLEAKGVLRRIEATPLRWYRV